VVALPSDTPVPDGIVEDPEAILESAVAFGDRMVIYRNNEAAVTSGGWDTKFNPGYSCGSCVDQPDTFDSFTPASCALQMLDRASGLAAFESCNWT
jgi:hypothetical protein